MMTVVLLATKRQFPAVPRRAIVCGQSSIVIHCKVQTTCPSAAPEVTPGFSGVRVDQLLMFCVVFGR